MEEIILGAVGVALSLMVSYFKPLANWFYSIKEDWRGLAMAALGLICTAAVFGLSCTGLFDFVACSLDSAKELLKAFLVLLVTNQITYLITPESPAKRLLKAV